MSYNGQALMGAQWHQIVGAACAGDQGAIALMGSAWNQIVGNSAQNGPGAGGQAHGPYGDPHGARRHQHQASGYGPQPRAWLEPIAGPTMANRQVLPMNTGMTPVPPNLTANITSRPQRVAFRPERVFVSAADIGGSGSAANWIINDITIGNRSQFAQSGALPGDMFSNVAIDSFVTFETAQTAMDVTMVVTYQGGTEGGTPFYGSIIGTAAV
jgi:hypothetical protein